jgi:uncharacterized protein YciI
MPLTPFQRLTIVRLMQHPDRPPPAPGDDAIQDAHVRRLRSLVADGTILVNGPIEQLDDPSFRGMSLYTVTPEEARALASEDPAVRAGWFIPVVDGWMFPAVPRMIGDRTDLEIDIPAP